MSAPRYKGPPGSERLIVFEDVDGIHRVVEASDLIQVMADNDVALFGMRMSKIKQLKTALQHIRNHALTYQDGVKTGSTCSCSGYAQLVELVDAALGHSE